MGCYSLGGLRDNAAVVSHSRALHLFRLTLLRMYDNGHSPGQEELLLDTMRMLKYTGDPWELVFDEEVRSCRAFIFVF